MFHQAIAMNQESSFNPRVRHYYNYEPPSILSLKFGPRRIALAMAIWKEFLPVTISSARVVISPGNRDFYTTAQRNF